MTLDYLATNKERCNSDDYGSWISGITEGIYELSLGKFQPHGFSARQGLIWRPWRRGEERIRVAVLRHRDPLASRFCRQLRFDGLVADRGSGRANDGIS